jgi:hypothetical protein
VEKRPYFVFGDFFSNAAVGSATALATAAVVGEGWNMVVAMVVGMALGMVIAMLLWLALFSWMFGAMEVMLPAMLTGMAAGMGIGMAEPMTAMTPLCVSGAAQIGALAGVAVVLLTYLLNARLRGKATEWTS